MTTSDIGALRALNAAAERARCEHESASMALGDACRRALVEAFGDWGSMWSAGQSALYIRFDDQRDLWCSIAAANEDDGDEVWAEAHADTPRAAVNNAIDALAAAHPAEAAALRLAVPGEPS